MSSLLRKFEGHEFPTFYDSKINFTIVITSITTNFFFKLVIARVAIVSGRVSRGSWDEQAKLAIKLSIVRV